MNQIFRIYNKDTNTVTVSVEDKNGLFYEFEESKSIESKKDNTEEEE